MIDDFTFADAYLEMFEDSGGIEHHGVKGQKHGVHQFGRWQSQAKYANGKPNPDAKKTSKGKGQAPKRKGAAAKKSSSSADEKARRARMRAKAQAAKAKLDAKNKQQQSKEDKKKQKILNDPRKLYKHRREFSADEIKKALDTFEMDRKLRDYADKKTEAGMKKVQNIVKVTKDSIDGYNQFARIFNTVGKSFGVDTKLPYVEQPKNDKDKEEERRRNFNNNSGS